MSDLEKKYYLGIDISKAKLDVYLSSERKHWQVANTSAGFKTLINTIRLLDNILVVFEASGGYEKPLAQALAKQNFSVALCNPRQIRDFAKATGRLAKTDRIDAELIALFAEKIQPPPNVDNDEKQQELAEKSARRKQLVDMITQEKNRLDKVSKDTRRSIQRIIKALEKECRDIEKQLESIIHDSPQYRSKHELLCSIKGVGNVTATNLIACLPELGKCTGKQITALAGLAPFNRDSGTLKGKRTIWGGRAQVRSALYMATLVAIRHNPILMPFYQRLCEAGKPKMLALTACMHKMIVIMNAMVKNNQFWLQTQV